MASITVGMPRMRRTVVSLASPLKFQGQGVVHGLLFTGYIQSLSLRLPSFI